MRVRRLLSAFVMLAALAVTTGCATPAAPVSDKVQKYYDENVTLKSTGGGPLVTTAMISVVGDSYTGGSGEGGYKLANWTSVAAGLLAKDNVNVIMNPVGIGGSGYVKAGQTSQNFGQIASEAVTSETTLIIYFGSRNDMDQDINAVQTEAARTFAESRVKAPQAKLLVIGAPWVDQSAPESITAINAALSTATAQSAGTFVDPVGERWFFDNPELIGADNTHPTDAGHAYMAAKIAPHIKNVLIPSAD